MPGKAEASGRRPDPSSLGHRRAGTAYPQDTHGSKRLQKETLKQRSPRTAGLSTIETQGSRFKRLQGVYLSD